MKNNLQNVEQKKSGTKRGHCELNIAKANLDPLLLSMDGGFSI
jgi:hypothetical protein